MTLGLTQPLTEINTRNISLGGGLKAAGAYDKQPDHLHGPNVLKSGSLCILEPSGLVQGFPLPPPSQLILGRCDPKDPKSLGIFLLLGRTVPHEFYFTSVQVIKNSWGRKEIVHKYFVS